MDVPGNMTPVAEFNTIADPVAAARIYALTGKDPNGMLPPVGKATKLGEYPKLDGRLRVIKFPLDITTQHTLRRDEVQRKLDPLIKEKSPLAEWVNGFLTPTFQKQDDLHTEDEGPGAAEGKEGIGKGATSISLHDIVVVWYALDTSISPDAWRLKTQEDIRIETIGQWTLGMCVTDHRSRARALEGEDDVPGDMGDWLSWKVGNRVDRCVGTPGARVLAGRMMDGIFGR